VAPTRPPGATVGDSGSPAVTDLPAESEGLTPTRHLTGVTSMLVKVLGGFYALYFFTTAHIGLVSTQAHRATYVAGAALLIVLVYPARRGKAEGRVPFYDWALAAAVVAAFGYYLLNYEEMMRRVGVPEDLDLALGLLAIILCFEVTRRTTGWPLVVVGVGAIAYAYFGEHLPGLFRHSGYSLNRIVNTQYMALDGIFGIVANIFATYVFLFVIFGVFLKRSGAARFFVDLPYALAGRLRGGPAKVALLVSALMGSITGSPVANVMTTGTFTVPAMKRAGYSGRFAGGVEAAASTGGQILPPVMGAGAFLIAEFTGTPYRTVVLVSLVPALLYFLSVYFLVDFEALKQGLRGATDTPALGEVVRKGWFFLAPLVVVFWLILAGYSPAFAALWGTVAAIAVGLVPYAGERTDLRGWFDALWEGSLRSLDIGGIVGTIGIVIGVLGLTGLGLRMSTIIVDFSGGYLFAALVLTALVSWILGMGLTSTSSYVIVAILAAPALQEFGVSVLAAHLIIFWVSQDANLTPPICLTAFAAAGVANDKPYATAYEAWKLGRGMYIVPVLMAYTPLIGGDWNEVLLVAIPAVAGIYLLSAGLAGFLFLRTHPVERGLLLLAGGLLVSPEVVSHAVGLAVGVAVAVRQYLQRRHQPASASARTDEPRST
jgi:TRAP transporter 4TM/12TM fusion protein